MNANTQSNKHRATYPKQTIEIKKRIQKTEIRPNPQQYLNHFIHPSSSYQFQWYNVNFNFFTHPSAMPHFRQMLSQLNHLNHHYRLPKTKVQDWKDKVPILIDEEKIQNSECAICIQDFHDKDVVSILECSHKFHQHCLRKWFELKPLCPICRKKVE